MYTLLKYRVYTVLLGYEDCNDVEHLKDDPALGQIFGGRLPSQPTLSRFENSVGRSEIWSLSEQMIEEYITTLKDREEMIIDVDSTDDKTHGSQEFSLFNGFYDHTIYNQLFFHDGQTGQIILPVLRPGNVHTSKWAVNILERIIDKIREVKNMCFADRLSDHRFWANYLRLFISSISFNLGLRIRQGIQETDHEKAHN